MPHISCQILGPTAITVDGAPVQLGSPKQRGIAALLILNAGQPVSLGRCCAELWGDEPPESAVATVQSLISRLRSALSAVNPAAGAMVGRAAGGYILRVPADSLDIGRFRRLVSDANECVEFTPAAALALLDEGLGLVSGLPLADVRDVLGEQVAIDARTVDELVRSARELRWQALLQVGEPRTVVLETAGVVEDQPLNEELHRLRMVALYQMGQQAQSLELYERLRHRLADELGVDPGPALRALHTEVVRQDERLSRPPRPVAPTTRTATQMVGRHQELAELTAAGSRAAAGAGSVWMLSGPAGIGKTRLCQEVLDGTTGRDEQAVVRASAHDTTAAMPYWLWGQLIQRLPQVGADGDPWRQLQQLSVVAQQSRLTLVVEDLQWADRGSLELLAILAERAAGSRLMMICTHRPEQADPASPLGALLARLARVAVYRRMELRGLDRSAVAELLAARSDRTPSSTVVELAVERTDGNPFFLTELIELAVRRDDRICADAIWNAWEGMPRSIFDVLSRRVAELPTGTQRVLDAAALIGRDVDIDLLAAVVEMSTEQLEAELGSAVDAGLVTERMLPRIGIRFVHALVREVLCSQLRPLRRARLEAAVMAAMLDAADVHCPA